MNRGIVLGGHQRLYVVGLCVPLTFGILGVALNGCGKPRDESDALQSEADDSANSDGNLATSRPVVRLEHDLGLLKPGESVVHRFTFRNDTSSPWTISQVHRTCVCDVAKTSQVVFSPGQEGWIDVTYKAPSERADDRKEILLSFKEESAPLLIATLRASVRDTYEIEPKTIIFRHVLGNDADKLEQTISFERFGSGELGVLDVESSVPWLEIRTAVEVTPRFEKDDTVPIWAPKESYRVVIAVNPRGLTEGVHLGTVVLTPAHQDSDDHDRGGDGGDPITTALHWEVPVDVIVTCPVKAHPPSLFLGQMLTGATATEYTVLDFLDFVEVPPINRAHVSHDLGDRLSVKLEQTAPRAWRLKCSFAAGQTTGIIEGRITIGFGGPLPSVTIPVNALVEMSK